MVMFDDSTATRTEESAQQRDRWSSKGRQVRLVLLTWPVVGLLGATVTAAACLLTECPLGKQISAKDTLVGQSGTVKSLSFRPDGSMMASVGVDGSIVMWELAATLEHRYCRKCRDRCGALSSARTTSSWRQVARSATGCPAQFQRRHRAQVDDQ